MPELFTSPHQLSRRIALSPDEIQWFEQRQENSLSPGCKIPEYYLNLIDPLTGKDDPIRRQCVPAAEEFTVKSYELEDPLGEQGYSPSSRLLHRYHDRALFLATDECFMYCRHCFRRRFTGHNHKGASEEEIDAAVRYVQNHKEIREVLISGGDPLTLSDDSLEHMVRKFRSVRKNLVMRLCTRAPVVYPQRITEPFVQMVSSYAPLYMITQYNHPRECTRESLAAVSACLQEGIITLNQTVLLRGVNDDPAVLQSLFRTLTANQIIPYYLFQGDLAAGTSHFRVPLRRGMHIAKQTAAKLSALAMPKFAVDLPGGGGKAMLFERTPESIRKDAWGYTDEHGKLYWYPLEES